MIDQELTAFNPTRGERPALDRRDIPRIRMLYKFPTAPAPGRTLELLVSGPPVLTADSWAGRQVEAHRIDFETVSAAGHAARLDKLPFPDASFDMVILHQIIDQLAALARQKNLDFPLEQLLTEIARVLTPRGIAAGCIENRYNLKHIGKKILSPLNPDNCLPPLSTRACRNALSASGFRNVNFFMLGSNPDAPNLLQRIEPDVSFRGSFWHLQRIRPVLSRSGYLLWLLTASLGVRRFLEPHLFFQGEKHVGIN